MSEQSPPVEKKTRSRWIIPTLTAAAGALVALATVGTFISEQWDKSNINSEEIAFLKATQNFNENQLADYKKKLSDSQRELAATQTALQSAKTEISKASSEISRMSEQNSALERSIQSIQAQNANLSESLRIADLCRPIQKRIAAIENKMELSGANFGGYSSHQLEDARLQLVNHQASLRTCLSKMP